MAWAGCGSPGPHADARAACLSATAYIHLMCPELPLRHLDAQAEPAIKEFEDGSVGVTVIDDLHGSTGRPARERQAVGPLPGGQRAAPLS